MIAFLIILGIGYFLIGVKNKVNAVQKSNGAREAISQNFAAIARLNEDFNRASSSRILLEAALPYSQEILKNFAPKINELARIRNAQATVKISNVLVDDGARPVRMSFTIRVAGPIRNITDFISDIESEKTLIEISNFEIASVNTLLYDASIEGYVYIREDAQN